jgi:ABC-type multidrug transport system ATPase subunit
LKGPDVTGEQLLNQAQFEDARLRSLSTYVEQEDFLVGSLTVAETISFAAKLALPPSLVPSERLQRTEDMLRDFGLNSVKTSCIGTPLRRGVSGGEKRRVTTASQLITLPKVIFLGTSPYLTQCFATPLITDEPTSGLDSTSAYEIISCLQSAAKEYNV